MGGTDRAAARSCRLPEARLPAAVVARAPQPAGGHRAAAVASGAPRARRWRVCPRLRASPPACTMRRTRPRAAEAMEDMTVARAAAGGGRGAAGDCEAALERLDGHTGRLDAVVRDQIRATLLEELRDARARKASGTVLSAARAASRREPALAPLDAAVAVQSAAVPLAACLVAAARRGLMIAGLRSDARPSWPATSRGSTREGGRIAAAPLRRCAAPVRAHRSRRARATARARTTWSSRATEPERRGSGTAAGAVDASGPDPRGPQ